MVDKSSVVASAVLVSAFHLLSQNNEIVKRWTNEIQEAMQSKHSMVQFHAVALLHALRANDRLEVSKLVSSLVKGSVRSVRHFQDSHDAIMLHAPVLMLQLLGANVPACGHETGVVARLETLSQCLNIAAGRIAYSATCLISSSCKNR